MKQTLIQLSLFLCVLFISSAASAKTYYFSSVSGNDSRTTAQAQTSSMPWQTLSKLNSIMSTLSPGDSVLFRAGETFYGSITLTKSGTSSNPIVFASYGSGTKPIITGFQTMGSWTSVGNGIYESYNSVLGTDLTMVTLNGNLQPMGRYPNINAANKGYLNFESHGSGYIKDNQLTSSTNWTGADVVIRVKRWILDRVKISSHSGTNIYYSGSLTYNPYDNYGYFIENSVKTLDQLGEWYYNPSNKKLSVYFGSSKPTSYSVQASAIAALVTIKNQNNIVFTGIGFTGSNLKMFDLYYAQNVQIVGCSMMYSGVDGIDASATTNLCVKSTYFNYTNNIAIDLNYNCAFSVLQYNYIANTGMTAGAGLNGNGSYKAVTIVGNDNLVSNNTVYNTGADAIRFNCGDNNVVKNNFINNFTMVKDDCGGVYSVVSPTGNKRSSQIIGNIIINGVGCPEGTDKPGTGSSNGVYIEDNSNNVVVDANTISNCGRSGVFVHNSFGIILTNNLLYDNLTQLLMIHDYAQPNALLRNNVVTDNIFFAKYDTQTVSMVSTMANDINLLGKMDKNYFCRPMDDNLTMSSSVIINNVRVDRVQDLAGWQSTYGLDKASQKAPSFIPAYSINSYISGNKFSNGTFNSNITGAYSTPSCSWVNNKLDGGTFQATNQYTNLSNYQIIVGIGAISSSKSYILKFSSLSSKDTLMNAYLRISGAPYSRLSDTKIIPISKTRQENQYLFTAPASCSAASIIFETKCPKVNFWLDNIELYDANVSQTDPNTYLFYQYNYSSNSKAFSIPGTYMDVYGKTYTNSVTIPAYSGVVLIKQTTANILYSFDQQKENQGQNVVLTRP